MMKTSNEKDEDRAKVPRVSANSTGRRDRPPQALLPQPDIIGVGILSQWKVPPLIVRLYQLGT